MGKNNKVTVWINNKKENEKTPDHPEDSYSIKDFREEQAAAVEDNDDEELPTLIRRHSHEGHRPTSTLFRKIKPLLLAGLSAVVIGSVLGFFMLNMFVDIDTGMGATGGTVTSTDLHESKGGAAAEQESTTSVTVEARQAFVLQAGKFNSAANAEKMADAFRQEGFSPMVWKKDRFHYVLAGISNSEKQAKLMAPSFSSKMLEVYVKKWSTPSFEINLSKEEQAWFYKYEQLWDESLIGLSRQEPAPLKEWKQLLSDTPDNAGRLSEITNNLGTELDGAEEPTRWEGQRSLLSLWHQTMSLN